MPLEDQHQGGISNERPGGEVANVAGGARDFLADLGFSQARSHRGPGWSYRL